MTITDPTHAGSGGIDDMMGEHVVDAVPFSPRSGYL